MDDIKQLADFYDLQSQSLYQSINKNAVYCWLNDDCWCLVNIFLEISDETKSNRFEKFNLNAMERSQFNFSPQSVAQHALNSLISL